MAGLELPPKEAQQLARFEVRAAAGPRPLPRAADAADALPALP
jgi:hypothetical protein